MNMKTRMDEHSLDSYYQSIEELGRKQRVVFAAIEKHPDSTASQVCDYTGFPINVVTGRINELMHLQLIKISGEADERKANRYAIRKIGDKLNKFEKSWEQKYHEMRAKFEAVVKTARIKGIDIEQTALF